MSDAALLGIAMFCFGFLAGMVAGAYFQSKGSTR